MQKHITAIHERKKPLNSSKCDYRIDIKEAVHSMYHHIEDIHED